MTMPTPRTLEEIVATRVAAAEHFLHNLFTDVENHTRADLTELKADATALVAKAKTFLATKP